MSRKKPLRSPFVVTVSAAAAATFAVACGGKTSSLETTQEPPYNPPSVVRNCTPATTAGSPCEQDGVSCVPLAGDQGDPISLRCLDGVWVNPNDSIPEPFPPPTCRPEDLSCPASIPTRGSSCASSCVGRYPANCTYPQGPDCPPSSAACDANTLRWAVSYTTCNPPQPVDAGAGDQ